MIEDIVDIDRSTQEGRLLFAALAKITIEIEPDKTPGEVISQLNKMADDWDSSEVDQYLLG